MRRVDQIEWSRPKTAGVRIQKHVSPTKITLFSRTGPKFTVEDPIKKALDQEDIVKVVDEKEEMEGAKQSLDVSHVKKTSLIESYSSPQSDTNTRTRT